MLSSILLKSKPWQIFIIISFVPFIYNTILNDYKFYNPHYDYRIFELIGYLLFNLFFIWIWAIVVELKKIITVQVSSKYFKIAIKYLVFYNILTILYVVLNTLGLSDDFLGMFNPKIRDLNSFIIIFAFSLPAVYSVFYCVYYAAKIIKMAELDKKVRFKDFQYTFFLLLFFFAGVWTIQPKLNAMYLKKSNL